VRVLFAAATPPGGTAPVNVIGVGMSLANNPTLNSARIFGLVGGKSPFQPTLTSAPASLAVQSTSTSGGLSFSTTGLAFPAAYVNFPSSTLSFTVTNNGPSYVDFANYNYEIVGIQAADFSITSDSCQVLNTGQTCTIAISFSPTASGVRNATLLVGPNGASQTIALSGAGLAHAGSSVTLSPSSLTFSLAGVPQPVIVTNNGMTPIAIGPITVGPYTNVVASETNNCGAVLAAQSICTIQVEASALQFNRAYGPSGSGTLTVMDSGNPGEGTVALNVPLTSEISFVPAPVDFGDEAVGITSKMTNSNRIIVENDIFQPVNITSSVVGPNASDFSLTQMNTIDQSNPSIVIDYFYVTFTPSGVGPRTANVVTPYGDIALSGNGIPDGPSFTIAQFPAGELTNTGSTVLTLSETITGPDASAFVFSASGSLTLAPAGTISFSVTGTALHVGANTATLTVTDATSGLSNSIPLSVVGYPQPPSLTPSSLTFGPTEIGVQSAAQTMTISAPEGDPVAITFDSGRYLPSDFAISPGTCATQTPCQISVTFTAAHIGMDSANYEVRDVITNQVASFSFRGSGGVTSVSLSSSSLTFAARDIGTTSIPQTVTLTNTGDAPLTISGETFSGANVGDFPIEANTCGSSLAGGANCTLTISFDPMASGTRSAILQIMTNAASSPDNIQLMGTAN
jgi:trimeric autotransporter adhesin